MISNKNEVTLDLLLYFEMLFSLTRIRYTYYGIVLMFKFK